MPWDYTYQGSNQVEIREMKEGENKNCAVEVVSNSDQPENSDKNLSAMLTTHGLFLI
jgi:hypothetical protein